MEAIRGVEREVERVITKFGALSEHTNQTLGDLLNQLKSLKQDLVILSRKLADPTSKSSKDSL